MSMPLRGSDLIEAMVCSVYVAVQRNVAWKFSRPITPFIRRCLMQHMPTQDLLSKPDRLGGLIVSPFFISIYGIAQGPVNHSRLN
jgi:hypothetical protein